MLTPKEFNKRRPDKADVAEEPSPALCRSVFSVLGGPELADDTSKEDYPLMMACYANHKHPVITHVAEPLFPEMPARRAGVADEEDYVMEESTTICCFKTKRTQPCPKSTEEEKVEVPEVDNKQNWWTKYHMSRLAVDVPLIRLYPNEFVEQPEFQPVFKLERLAGEQWSQLLLEVTGDVSGRLVSPRPRLLVLQLLATVLPAAPPGEDHRGQTCKSHVVEHVGAAGRAGGGEDAVDAAAPGWEDADDAADATEPGWEDAADAKPASSPTPAWHAPPTATRSCTVPPARDTRSSELPVLRAGGSTWRRRTRATRARASGWLPCSYVTSANAAPWTCGSPARSAATCSRPRRSHAQLRQEPRQRRRRRAVRPCVTFYSNNPGEKVSGCRTSASPAPETPPRSTTSPWTQSPSGSTPRPPARRTPSWSEPRRRRKRRKKCRSKRSGRDSLTWTSSARTCVTHSDR